MIIFYLTPVLYPISILNKHMQDVVLSNPLTSYLEIFRWSFSNNASPEIGNWIYMIFSSVAVFLIGSRIFKAYWPRIIVML
jgi:ABC-type polysaccharide/polyol phosphate export permease